MNDTRKVQSSITISSLIIVGVHLIWPALKIDGVTITLIIVAVLPWLAPLIKSLELPGGLKFEFQEDLNRVEQKAKAAGLIKDKPIQAIQKYSFMNLVELDPQLALAGLRIELEKSLKKLAEQNKSDGFAVSNTTSLSAILREMSQKKILTHQESAALADMVGVLNQAVHGQELGYRAIEWAIDIGPQILDSVNKKIEVTANINSQ
jgi:hypothetical protein